MKNYPISSLAFFLAAIIILSAGTSCSQKSSKGAIPISGIRSTENSHAHHLKLDKEAFENLFLLGTTLTAPPPAPSNSSLANKIVFFRRQGDLVFMFEGNNGKIVTDTLASEVLLAKFPVISSLANGAVVIDFQKGMSNLFASASYFVGDAANHKSMSDTVFDITHSYVKMVEKQEEYTLIEQVVRINDLTSEKQESISAHIYYSLSPYIKNENFSATESSELKKVGHFTVRPVLGPKEEDHKIPIMKFDLSKRPIVYYLSPNIPPSLKETVAEGILYWNKALGAGTIEVKDLPDDINLHHPRKNIVEWLNWDSAGFAYADLSSDPLTGEILRSRVYLTSGLASLALKNNLKIYRRIRSIDNDLPKKLAQMLPSASVDHKPGLPLTLKGFAPAAHCHLEREFKVANIKTRLKAYLNREAESGFEISEEEIATTLVRLVKDDLRAVVAHEVGHTLGLRHNFAASTATDLTVDNYHKVRKNYVLKGVLDSKMQIASSVMDYLPTLSNAMVGVQIEQNEKALPYDKNAIQYAYQNAGDDLPFGPFCTDGHLIKQPLADCQRFDFLNNPILEKKALMQDYARLMPLALSDRFSQLDRQHLIEPLGDPSDEELEIIEQIHLDPQDDALRFAVYYYFPLIKAVSTATEFVSVQNSYEKSYLVSKDQENYQNATKDYLGRSLQQTGGLAHYLFSDLLPTESKMGKTATQVATMLENFSRYIDQSYPDITPEARTKLLRIGNEYFDVFEKHFLLAATVLLNNSTLAVKDNLISEALNRLASHVLLSKKPEKNKGGDGGFNMLQMPKYRYVFNETSLRQEMANLLNHDFYPTAPSYRRQMSKLATGIVNSYETEKAAILGDQKQDSLSDYYYDWFMAEDAIFGTIITDSIIEI